jgi:dienelactone hydrolase
LAVLDYEGKLTSLHADPRGEADLDEVVLDPRTGQPLIASYRSTVAANYGLAPAARNHVQAIERRYPQRNLSIDVGHGGNARWLVRERSGSLKGALFHLYDPATGDFRDILQDIAFRHAGKTVARPPESAMARRIAFTYRASDGMRLHGFLMVPPGIDAARAPLMAHVHGGPFNLARPEFSSTGQLLANRGYVVFEPNFRGSTGLGRDYLFSAHGDLGNGRVQQDIVEGVRFLLALGIGDPSRVGIDGASFGGYSALLGATFQPELFKVGIAAVPPADFGWVLRWYSHSADQFTDGIPMSTTMRLLSLDPADPGVAERLQVQSPIANAGKLSRPLLLLAGADDERVPIRSVTHYAAELKRLGKDFSLFIDAEGRHQLEDPRTREAYFYLMEQFLHRRLGGATPQPPSKPLREHLRRNLQVKGSDFSDF